ncbi:MAG TPA: nucleoside deaminase [Terriglobia bacterium]|nr:nucleoside deaminase [Terriglobia bacterium]
MLETLALALDNVRAGRGGPFAALVVKGEEVLGRGTNLVTATNDPTAHAEILALRAACRYLGDFHLEGCEVYTSSEPCPMCLAAMYWARVRGYYYGNSRSEAARIGFDDSLIYDELGKPPGERLVPGSRLLAEEAVKVLDEWERSPLKVNY